MCSLMYLLSDISVRRLGVMEDKEEKGGGVVIVPAGGKDGGKDGCKAGGGGDEDKREVLAVVAVPPDGGWGWVIVAASFMCNLIVDGIVFSFGVFLDDIAEDLSASKTEVTIAGSLLSGVYMIIGPLVSALANRYGFRVVCIGGAVLSSAAFVLSSFARSIFFLWFSYGVLGGIGFGMIYVPAVIACGFYFERLRALATGISVCGSGIGTIVMSPLATLLINNFGWRNALLIQAGILLSCIIFGALFRPLKGEPVPVTKGPNEDEDEAGGLPLMQRIKLARDRRRSDSFTETEVIALQPPDSSHKLLRASNNAVYPTAAEAVGRSTNSLAGKRLSLTSKEAVERLLARRDSATQQRLRARSTSESSGPRSRRNTLTQGQVRPMYRDDIFLSSLNKIPQFHASRMSGLEYTMSVTRLPTWEDVEEETKCNVCPEAIRRTLATMLDFSLLLSPTFLLFALSGFATMMGLFVPFMFLKDRLQKQGLDETMAVTLVSSIGITNTVGRVVCGAIGSLPQVDSLLLNNVALTVGGIITAASGFSFSLPYQFTFTLVFGLSIACFASLRSVLLVDLVGLERLTNAFGLLLLFQGTAAAIGSPVAGLFQDLTNSYDVTFYLSGGLIALSGIMLFPLKMLHTWEQNRKESKHIDHS